MTGPAQPTAAPDALDQRISAIERVRKDADAWRVEGRFRPARLLMLVVVVLLGAGSFAWYTTVQEGRAQKQRDRAEHGYKVALDSIKQLVGQIKVDSDNLTIQIQAAKDLLVTLKRAHGELEVDDREESEVVGMQLLLELSDTWASFNESSNSLELAQDAKGRATELLTGKRPSNAYLHLSFRGSFLIADALVNQGKLPEGLAQYREAEASIRQLLTTDPFRLEWKLDLARINKKIGDALTQQNNYQEALSMYGNALTISDGLTKAAPLNLEFQFDLATTHIGIGRIMTESAKSDKQFDDALSEIHVAEAILAEGSKTAAKSPSDPAMKIRLETQIANSHHVEGDIHTKHEKWTLALQEYQTALNTEKGLSGRDPQNSTWLGLVAREHSSIAAVHVKREDWPHARDEYSQAKTIYQALADKDPSNANWPHKLATVSDALSKLPGPPAPN